VALLGFTLPTLPQRQVSCTHCGHAFEVAPKASVLTCASCYQRVNVEDVRLTRETSGDVIETAGRIFVGPRARVIAKAIRGGAGIDIQGIVEGHIASWKRVTIGPAAWFRGSCEAPVLQIAPGAQVDGASFKIGVPQREPMRRMLR
jgi:cytoskeletal protein CcmA (bactofilin family)